MRPASPPHQRRRALAALGLLGIGAALGQRFSTARAGADPRLFVFLPVLERSRAVQETLSAGLSGVNVTVFGRFADFAALVEAERPEGMLCLPDTLRSVGAVVQLQGLSRGSGQEAYVVLAKEPVTSMQELANHTVGAVDIVGRAELPRLVQRLLGVAKEPSVRRALKMSDLLPLLQLDLAAGVLLPERFLEESLRMNRLSLRILRPPTAVLPRVALGGFESRADGGIERALRRAPASVKRTLGVEAWK